MNGTIIDLIHGLSEVDLSDRFNPPILYAEGGANAVATARAMVCNAPDDDQVGCPLDPTLSEVLMVSLAISAIRVWRSWRNHRLPTQEEKYEAVIYYAQHDAYQPLETDR